MFTLYSHLNFKPLSVVWTICRIFDQRTNHTNIVFCSEQLPFYTFWVHLQLFLGADRCAGGGGRHIRESSKKSSGFKSIIVFCFNCRQLWSCFEAFCWLGKAGSWWPRGLGFPTWPPPQQMHRPYEVSWAMILLHHCALIKPGVDGGSSTTPTPRHSWAEQTQQSKP